MLTGLIFWLLTADAPRMLEGSPIHVAEDPAHGVVCYWIPFAMRFNMQPALSCVHIPGTVKP